MNKRKRTSSTVNTNQKSDITMLGKRLWLDVEQLSLSDRRDSKKSAACSDHDSPTVLQKAAVCKSDCISSLSTSMLSPADQRKHHTFRQPEQRMDPTYRKHVVRHVLQPSGHAVLPERVSLQNMVQICHSVWNGDDDDSSSF